MLELQPQEGMLRLHRERAKMYGSHVAEGQQLELNSPEEEVKALPVAVTSANGAPDSPRFPPEAPPGAASTPAAVGFPRPGRHIA